MSKIEWTDRTWNPTTGCDQISRGCDNCYAMTLARRLKAMGQPKYQNDGDPRTSGPGFGLTLHPDTLNDPYTWRTPQMVFVNSMSDLFHARVPLDFVRRVIEVIEQTPQHTYQILTKRASRLPKVADKLTWPPNLWMGISVEDADHLDRVDDLRCVPAAARFLSCEPLVGPLDGIDLTGIDWVIVGGESGAKASPMHPDWARSLRDKCQQAKIPYFFKQWGSWAPTGKVGLGQPLPGEIFAGDPDDQGWRVEMRRVAKKSAFRELDGRTWDEFPQPHHRREVA